MSMRLLLNSEKGSEVFIMPPTPFLVFDISENYMTRFDVTPLSQLSDIIVIYLGQIYGPLTEETVQNPNLYI